MNKRTRQHQQNLHIEIMRWKAIKHEFTLPIRYAAVEKRMGLTPKKTASAPLAKVKSGG